MDMPSLKTMHAWHAYDLLFFLGLIIPFLCNFFKKNFTYLFFLCIIFFKAVMRTKAAGLFSSEPGFGASRAEKCVLPSPRSRLPEILSGTESGPGAPDTEHARVDGFAVNSGGTAEI